MIRLDECGLIDVDPIKLRPTWRNESIGADDMWKRLDRFVLFEGLVGDNMRVREWVGIGGDYGHFPILLKLPSMGKKPSSPFKFNP